MADSSTGGILIDTHPNPSKNGAALDAVFQALISSITVLPGNLVRPRWGMELGKIPEFTTDWCAFGISSDDCDPTPYILHNSDNQGSDIYIIHEDIRVLTTFYGPDSQNNAAALRDGVRLLQNLEQLDDDSIAFVKNEPLRNVPEFVNQHWLRRCDLEMVFRRKITRIYATLNLLSAPNQIVTDVIGAVNPTGD